MNKKAFILIPLIFILLMNCVNKGTLPEENKTIIVTAPIVFKNYVAKNGIFTDKIEAYLQLFAQDYFIKFSESDISLEDFEIYLAQIEDEIKIITVEIEIRDGCWDISYSDINDLNEPIPQSRIGEYVVLYRIIEQKK